MKNEIIIFYPGLRGHDKLIQLRRTSRTEPTVTRRVIMKEKISKLSSAVNKKLKGHKTLHKKRIWTSRPSFVILYTWISPKKLSVRGGAASASKWKLRIKEVLSTLRSIAGHITGSPKVDEHTQRIDGTTQTATSGLDHLGNYGVFLNTAISWKRKLVVSLRSVNQFITSMASGMITVLKTWSYGLAGLGMVRGRRILSARIVKRHILLHRALLLASVLIIVGLSYGLMQVRNNSHNKSQLLNQRQHRLNELHQALEATKAEGEDTKAQLEIKAAQEATLRAEIEKLNKDLQSKREQQSLLARARQLVAPTAYAAPRAAPSGSCADWMRAAGVTDMANAAELIRRESGCNPSARNKSSGACGIAQELPCNKSGCGGVGGDPICQIRWMQGYVVSTYGSWAGAVSFHNANNWY